MKMNKEMLKKDIYKKLDNLEEKISRLKSALNFLNNDNRNIVVPVVTFRYIEHVFCIFTSEAYEILKHKECKYGVLVVDKESNEVYNQFISEGKIVEIIDYGSLTV